MNKNLKAYHIKIIREIWEKKQRVPYCDFMEQLKTSEAAQITAPTFSRILNEFLKEKGTRIERSAKELFAVHLIKYYAARYQDSIDVIVQCFIKAASLMRFRVNKSYDESSGKESRALLEDSNAQFPHP